MSRDTGAQQPSRIRRVIARVTPQFLEDWLGTPGTKFHKTMEGLSEYNREHVRPGERAEALPDLAFRAIGGAASAQHAKAEADYAKAENDRIEAELRRRTLEAKTRHECADAEKAEAEAKIAHIREMQARVELFNQLNAAGVSVTIDSALNLVISPAPKRSLIQPAEVWSGSELASVDADLITVTCPDFSRDGIEVSFYRWRATVGSRLEKGDPICDVMFITSPPTSLPITAPVAGMVIRIFEHAEHSLVPPNAVMAMLLKDLDTQ